MLYKLDFRDWMELDKTGAAPIVETPEEARSGDIARR